MIRPVLYGLSLYFFLSGAYMWAAPMHWYASVPGVPETGGYNSHFIRDVALAFAVSALALATAARLRDPRLAFFGAAWPVLHALFHIWIWVFHRGTATDLVALINLIGIQVPGWAALIAATSLKTSEVSA